jgi:Uma2 family endonuclease
MSVIAEPVRHEFEDYVRYSETHPDGAFELIDGVIYKLAPEGDAHLLTRSGIAMLLSQTLDLARFTPWTEASFPAAGWADGPRPDNFVSRGPWLAAGKFTRRPAAEDIALVIEVSSSSRPKDRQKARLYARLGIPEYWLVDLIGGVVAVFRQPAGDGENAAYQWSREFGNDKESIASSAVDDLSISTAFLLQLSS